MWGVKGFWVVPGDSPLFFLFACYMLWFFCNVCAGSVFVWLNEWKLFFFCKNDTVVGAKRKILKFFSWLDLEKIFFEVCFCCCFCCILGRFKRFKDNYHYLTISFPTCLTNEIRRWFLFARLLVFADKLIGRLLGWKNENLDSGGNQEMSMHVYGKWCL